MRIELGSIPASSGILIVIVKLRNRWIRINDSVIRANYNKDVFKIEWECMLASEVNSIKRR